MGKAAPTGYPQPTFSHFRPAFSRLRPPFTLIVTLPAGKKWHKPVQGGTSRKLSLRIFRQPRLNATPTSLLDPSLAHFQMSSARVRFRSWIHRFQISLFPYFMMSKSNAASRNREAVKFWYDLLVPFTDRPNFSTIFSRVKSAAHFKQLLWLFVRILNSGF